MKVGDWKWSALLVTTLAVVLITPATAWACVRIMEYDWMTFIDEEPQEAAQFPLPVVLELNHLNRGERPRIFSGDSCGQSTSMGFHVHGYDDDYGLLFEFEGTHPDTFSPTDEAIVLFGDTFSVIWNDGQTRNEPFDMIVTARWVDEYGRVGPQSDPLHITDAPGGCACSASGGKPEPATLLVVLLIFGVLMRRHVMRFRLKSSTPLLIVFFAMVFLACGETDLGETGEEEQCALEYETFCEGPDCCPENCYSLVGRIIDVHAECRLDDNEAHWCISPEIFTPGAEVQNNTVPRCYYDDDTGTALVTPNPADGLSATGGPLVACDSDVELIVFEGAPDPCPSAD